MNRIEIRKLSKVYDVRRLHSGDINMILHFCRRNTQYYAYCGKNISAELIEHDMQVAPPGIPPEQKYYIGFFESGMPVALMDLIVGYPSQSCAFIGFFMMNADMQGAGTGSRIVSQALEYLKTQGLGACRLGIDKNNPQSNHFWRKNGFVVIREIVQEEGTILLAERRL